MSDVFKIYGVKNDEYQQKLLDILDSAEIEYQFYDFREFPPDKDQIIIWAEFLGEDFPLNLRSSFFKKNKKKFEKLASFEQKVLWLGKNYHALAKPIIEDEGGEILSIGGRPERLAIDIFGLEKY